MFRFESFERLQRDATLNARERRRIRRRAHRIEYNTRRVKEYGMFEYRMVVDDAFLMYAATLDDIAWLLEYGKRHEVPVQILDPYAIRVVPANHTRWTKSTVYTLLYDYFSDFGDIAMFSFVKHDHRVVALDIVFLDRNAPTACLLQRYHAASGIACIAEPVVAVSPTDIPKPWSPARSRFQATDEEKISCA